MVTRGTLAAVVCGLAAALLCLSLGACASGRYAAGDAATGQPEAAVAVPQAEAAEEKELTPLERVARMDLARDRLIIGDLKDLGNVFRAVYDEKRDVWVQVWHSPECPCRTKAKPGAGRFD